MASVSAEPRPAELHISDELSQMSKLQRAELIRLHDLPESDASGASDASACALLLVPLATCPICLDTAPLETRQSEGLEDERAVRRCSVCLAPFHRICAGKTLVAAAEEGGARKLPVCCPIRRCSSVWPAEFVGWALDEEQMLRYGTACRAANELHAAAAGQEEVADENSPRTAEALRHLGVRSCPQCRSLIQKQVRADWIVHHVIHQHEINCMHAQL